MTETAMHTLTEAIALVDAGWSPRNEIAERATLMRRHAEAENTARAEEYAVEIEALQRTMLERDGRKWGAFFGPKPNVMPEWAVEEWKIGHAAWGVALIHAYLLPRGVWAGEGWTAEDVAANARRVSPCLICTAADMIAPRVPVGRAAA